MPELPPIFLAALTGFISGLLLSVPVGPVNLTIINDGAQRGFKWRRSSASARRQWM